MTSIHLPNREAVEATGKPAVRDQAVEDFLVGLVEGRKPSVDHAGNGDEALYQDRGFLGSFTKGLPRQTRNGTFTDVLPVAEEFIKFRFAIHAGDFFGDTTPQPHLGPPAGLGWQAAPQDTPLRGWEAPEAGLTFEPHGPDSHSVTMPPPPKLESDQLAYEMAEVYWLSLLRDVSLSRLGGGINCPNGGVGELPPADQDDRIDAAIKCLNNMPYALNGYQEPGQMGDDGTEIPSRNRNLGGAAELTRQTVFRGATAGDVVGPYVSQFLLIGSPMPNDGANKFKEVNIVTGEIGYGAQVIHQKYSPHRPQLDFLTARDLFLDAQEGARLGGEQFGKARFITTPRDLATYVHYDALYQAYLNACLILLGFGAPADPGIAIHSGMNVLANGTPANVTQGFSLFGGPHVLNLVTEVSTRALKAVRHQKFNVHCRLRPEAVGGVVEFDPYGVGKAIEQKLCPDVITRIQAHPNGNKTKLLPMAFPEGSPMHPSYGAGHATVAGACVTMLKAFFDTDAVFARDLNAKEIRILPRSTVDQNPGAYAPVAYVSCDGNSLVDVKPKDYLTVGGELDKLAANIAIARNMAGVHFYCDYIDSLLMGEEVALDVLKAAVAGFSIYPRNARPQMTLRRFPRTAGGPEVPFTVIP